VRFLFKPGWVAFVLVVIGFAVACYTLLAPWQFRRNAERAAENSEIAASFANPPAPLAQLVPPGSPPAPSLEWRRALVTGQYLPADEAVVRLRTVLGRPAFEVLTAFRTDDGRIIAVDRGYVRPGEDRQVSEYPPAPDGTVTLTGRLRIDESDPQQRASFTSGGHRQLYAADSQLLAQSIGKPVAGGYLQLVDNQPGGVGVLPLPDSDSGPFLSYAWQWLTFGAMALFGLGYFIRLELLQRRAPDDPDPDTPDPDEPGPAAETSPRDPPPSARPEREPAPGRDRLAERYGKARF
jgi:cytochrome oxidase assembly protein ShyY1